MQCARRRQTPSIKTVKSGAMEEKQVPKAPVTLTCFSCCATEAATSFTAAAETILPPAQNLDPFATVATATGPAVTATGTTASCPDSAPTPWSRQKHRLRAKNQKLTSRTLSRVGVEHCDPAHKVVIHGNIHGDFGAPHRCLSIARWRGRPSHMWGSGRRRHASAGGGRLCARPRHLCLTPRVPPTWQTPDVSVTRLGDPSPSLPIQHQQHFARNGKFSSHALIVM
jgi:hypothetical protein